ncbi:alpha/beta hydrolase [Pseudomonas sp. UBA2684]|uniref:alpha/beta hydrolase n=1 Tax=Pseudomonas sp. UBA2684 TaxID=1947311 RepID=UPI000E966F3D|nr:alpha/beta hydrolase [Pseudomonas sp. UBA2684]HBX54360.1 alpha/beta hydrolase [Pseudomonas sp.]|tara:strand:+ start:5361 stop:6323 length:963 start_codon:yes stop_codon:yes gene_type:complete
MLHDAFWLSSSDAAPLYVNRWFAEQPPKAVVMVAHGMAEHSGRYARLGAALVAAGYELYAHDQRGHGKTAEHGMLGHYADDNGWQQVVGDLACLNHQIRQTHPQAPIFLLGHSMGSYIGQAYLMQHSCSLQGAILSGSNYQPVALYRVAQRLAHLERWRQGPTGRSALIEFLSFGSFNQAFKPTRTAFDWLSRDPAEVDKYVNDPLCGFRCGNQLWIDLLGGLQQITPVKNLAQIDSSLPLLVIGGACDPVSNGKRLEALANALRQAGNKQVHLKIYPDARHELLNESNRDEVTAYLIDWLEQALRLPRQRHSQLQEIQP